MFNFTRPGVGISKDAPKKEGIALFFDIVYRDFWTLFTLNLLFIITTMPIITIGPSICALNFVCARMIRDEPIDVFDDYKRGFFMNFWQGLGVGIIVLLIFAFLGTSCYMASIIFPHLAYVILFIIAFFCAVNVYIFPLVSCIKLPTYAIFKNSFSLAVVCLKPTFASLAINTAITVLLFLFITYTFYFYIFMGFAFFVFVNMFFAYPVIEKYVSIAKEKPVIEVEATFKD